MNFFGTDTDDLLEGQESNDLLIGEGGNDILTGNDGNDRLIGGNQNSTVGGRDTLVGGLGNDGYVVSLNNGGGSQIQDAGGTDAVLILDDNTDSSIFNSPDSFADASLYGNAAITLSPPQSGIVGLEKSGNNLIVDIDRDGFADPENDLLIVDFFDEQGGFGTGAVESLNNIVEPQNIVNFFNNLAEDAIVGTDSDDFLEGTDNNDTINGGAGNDFLSGGAGNDFLTGGTLDRDFATVGGRDTLEGGDGDDNYGISLTSGGGTTIQDTSGMDMVTIFAENTNLDGISNGSVDLDDPTVYGDAAITLSLPQSGTVGLDKSGNNLIIDINRDGFADGENDLTIFDFFDEQGQLGTGSVELINNIVDTQEIVSLFAGSLEISDDDNDNVAEEDVAETNSSTVYRFFNNSTGVHFYTAEVAEKEEREQDSNFVLEGAAYDSINSMTGSAVPVYRLFNEDSESYLYTISENERNVVEEFDNYSFAGEAFFAYATEEENSIPIYRLYNSSTGEHFYTPSATERDSVVDNSSDFQFEGIAYYALPSTVNDSSI